MVWNIWFKSQINSDKLALLLDKIDGFLEEYDPDVFGLHEVLTDMKTGESAVLNHLRNRGYTCESTPFSPMRKKWLTGNAVAYKNRPEISGSYTLGPDTPAKLRGHDGYEVKLMFADVQTADGKTVHFILNYLAHLVPYNWPTHLLHLKNFNEFIKQKTFDTRTVVVGDFNEFKWMLPIWNKRFNRKTGNIFNPTWRLQGRWPIQANYDNVCWDSDGSIDLKMFSVLSKRPSDHAALVARFEIK